MALDSREFREQDDELDVMSSLRADEHAHVSHRSSMTRRDALRVFIGGGAALALGDEAEAAVKRTSRTKNTTPTQEENIAPPELSEAQKINQQKIDELTKKLEAKGFHFPEKYEVHKEGNELYFPGIMMPERGWVVEPVCVSRTFQYSSPSKKSKLQFSYPMLRHIGEQRNLGAKIEVLVDGEPYDVLQGVVYTKPYDNPFLSVLLEGLQGKHTVEFRHITNLMNALHPLDEAKNMASFSAAAHKRLTSQDDFPHRAPNLPDMHGEKDRLLTCEGVSMAVRNVKQNLKYVYPPPLTRLLPKMVMAARHSDCGGFASLVANESGALYVEGYHTKTKMQHAFNYAAVPNVGGFIADATTGQIAPQDRRMIMGSIGGLHYIDEPKRKSLRKAGIPALEKNGEKIGVDIKLHFADHGTNGGLYQGQDARFTDWSLPVFSTVDNGAVLSEYMMKLKEEADPDTKALFEEMMRARATLYPQAQRLAAQ